MALFFYLSLSNVVCIQITKGLRVMFLEKVLKNNQNLVHFFLLSQRKFGVLPSG